MTHRPKNYLICFVAAIAISSLTTVTFAQSTETGKVVTLSAGINIIHAEVAATPSQRAQGLMFRQKMGANEGMVFVFEQPADVCMWMKNTLLPLSVAFIDNQGKVVNIEDMQPQSLDSHCAVKQVRYALEMNRGWFKQKNIKPGTLINGLEQKQ